MIAAIDPFLFSDWGCCAVAHHFEYYFNLCKPQKWAKPASTVKKITNKINRNPLLHSCPWDSKSVAYIRILNIISKFWNHLPLGFNNAHKRHYGIPIRLVNICKVSSLGNQIPQSTKWATGTLSSHAFAYLSLYDARCTQIHLFSLCWDCSNNSKAELGAAVQAVLWRLFCFAEALTLLTLNSVGAGFQRTEE